MLGCNLVLLCRYTRQLIHLTRYDIAVKPPRQQISRAQKLAGAVKPPCPISSSDKRQKNLSAKVTSGVRASSDINRESGSIRVGGSLEDPTQLDTLIISEDEVQYLNSLTEQAVSDERDRKDATANLSDSEFHQWIIDRAKEGSVDAEYALSKWFTPPAFAESGSCYVCHGIFGISKFRHHCRHCGKSVCGDHSMETRKILKYGFTAPTRVCDSCAYIIDKESRMDRQVWKQQRLKDYLNSTLIPYFEVAEDRGVDKAFRYAVLEIFL